MNNPKDLPKTIAMAFLQAQRGFAPALKTSVNPHFRSKYADLAACVEAVIDSLNANGIALVQHTHECADGVIVETMFLHESGESLSCGKLHVPAAKNDPQGYGSALTYARRYSLMAACGIAPEDDDAEAGTKAVRAKQAQNESASADEALSLEIDACFQHFMRVSANGSDALTKEFQAHKKPSWFAQFWATNKDQFKKRAAEADGELVAQA